MQFEYAKLSHQPHPTKVSEWILEYSAGASPSDEKDLLVALNKYGLDGWEVAGNLPAPENGLLLKRAKSLFPAMAEPVDPEIR